MDQIKLETMCNNIVIPSRERYNNFEELMVNKSLVIKILIKDVQVTLEMSTEMEQDVISQFEKMSYKILSQDGELLSEDLILSGLVSELRQELESG